MVGFRRVRVPGNLAAPDAAKNDAFFWNSEAKVQSKSHRSWCQKKDSRWITCCAKFFRWICRGMQSAQGRWRLNVKPSTKCSVEAAEVLRQLRTVVTKCWYTGFLRKSVLILSVCWALCSAGASANEGRVLRVMHGARDADVWKGIPFAPGTFAWPLQIARSSIRAHTHTHAHIERFDRLELK